MSPAFPSRRRAEQFDRLLDGTLTEAPSQELSELLAFAGRVQALPEVQPRAEFAASLRERLMAEAPAALSTPDPVAERLTVGRRAPSQPRRERRIGLAVAAFSIVGATTASAVASQGALPGDTLYPIKRILEGAHVTLAMGDEARGSTLLSQATARLEEARALGRAGDDADTAAIAETLDDFTGQAGDGADLLLQEYADQGDASAVHEVRSFAEDGLGLVDELTALLPPALDAQLADAARELLAIDARAAAACPACDSSGITELPASVVALLGITPTAESVPAVSTPVPGTRPRRPGKTQAARPTSDGSAAPAPSPSIGGSVDVPQLPQPGSAPTSAGDAVGQVGGAAGGAVSGAGDAVSGAGGSVGGAVGGAVGGVGDAVGGVGGAVGDTTGTVGDTVDGVVGGLLGGLTGSQTPAP